MGTPPHTAANKVHNTYVLSAITKFAGSDDSFLHINFNASSAAKTPRMAMARKAATTTMQENSTNKKDDEQP